MNWNHLHRRLPYEHDGTPLLLERNRSLLWPVTNEHRARRNNEQLSVATDHACGVRRQTWCLFVCVYLYVPHLCACVCACARTNFSDQIEWKVVWHDGSFKIWLT